MLRYEKSAPIWLFSFVDLAFLLLIAFTQIGPDINRATPDLGELEIPRIASSVPALERKAHAPSWQLRVYPAPADDDAVLGRTPFELVEPGAAPLRTAEASSGSQVDADELIARLRVLHNRQIDKPILAPHRDARAEDLLVAVGLLEDVWQAGRTVAVLPGGGAVASGPDAEERDAQ